MRKDILGRALHRGRIPAEKGRDMKLAIIGSRSIGNFDLSPHIPGRPSLIISGGARGVDTLAERHARAHRIALRIFLPDYAAYGRAAPLIRNRKIAEECDQMLAVWDGRSKGTKYTIDYARSLGKNVRVVTVEAQRK